ncbi:MAG: tRNA pseudouridine(54/55) synthase Pus10 [Candidatus Hodarchaeales archaeon]
MDSQLFSTILPFIEKYHVCNSCLGRQFGNILTGLSNADRGSALKIFFMMEWEINHRQAKTGLTNISSLMSKDFTIGEQSVRRYFPETETITQPCTICQDFLSIPFLESLAKEACDLVTEYEFSTFLVGSRFPPSIIDNEDITRSTFNLEYGESIKSDFNRELGKILSTLIPEATVDFKAPDIVFTFNLVHNEIDIKSNPLFILGRYKKLERGIPQSKWFCRKCRGEGCNHCNFTGKMYQDSVEEYSTAPFFEAAKGISSKFHGSGREDIDARMLGTGRPFVIEISEPKIRNLDFPKIIQQISENSDGKVEVTIDGLTNRTKVREIKTRSSRNAKAYRAIVTLEKSLSKDHSIVERIAEELSNILIQQRTPIRVAHRRADKIRTRKVTSFTIEKASKDELTVHIVCEGGLYVKELISGDQGRTKPSFSEKLGFSAVVKELDVIEVFKSTDPTQSEI